MSEGGGEGLGSTLTAPGVTNQIAGNRRIGPLWSVLRGRISFVLALVLVAFVLRAIAAVVLEGALIAAGGDGFIALDDRAYNQVAWQQAQAWRGVGPGVHPRERYLLNVYTYTEAALYLATGHQPLAMKLLNCLFGALTAGLIYLTARRLFSHLAACLSGIAAAFFPSTFLWSTTNLKDAMFLFFLALILWLLTWLVLTARQRLIVPLLVTLAIIGGLRIYIQALLAIVIPGTVLLQSGARFARKWATGALLMIGCAAALWLSGGARWVVGYLPFIDQQRYLAAAGANSAYVPTPGPTERVGVGESSPAPATRSLRGLITWLPTGLVYALAAPFPWAAQRTVERITIPEVLLWYVALALATIAIAVHWRRWQSYAHLLGFIGSLLLLLALTQGNLGTLVRQRGMAIPFTLVFSGEGAAWLWSRWRARRERPGQLPAGARRRRPLGRD